MDVPAITLFVILSLRPSKRPSGQREDETTNGNSFVNYVGRMYHSLPVIEISRRRRIAIDE